LENKTKYDAGDPAHVKRKKTRAQIKREGENEDIKQVLETQSGRNYIWKLLTSCGIYKSSFTGNSTTFFNEGKRSIGLEMLEDILKTVPNAYAKMSAENNNKDNH
tara:strand:- start:2296 stop:2610 length:315 start_codon:yes stop_codon:yes gene_type:complete